MNFGYVHVIEKEGSFNVNMHYVKKYLLESFNLFFRKLWIH